MLPGQHVEIDGGRTRDADNATLRHRDHFLVNLSWLIVDVNAPSSFALIATVDGKDWLGD